MAAEIREKVKRRADILTAAQRQPGLAVILVGDDPASVIYVRNKHRSCEQCGIRSIEIHLPETTTQSELEEQILKLNADPSVHGILVQLPLPKGLNERKALNTIAPEKDVDGFHLLHGGQLLAGEPTVEPCTPRGVMYMIHAAGVPLAGKHAVIIGRSNIVGKPVALMLLAENCTVTMCHSYTRQLKEMTKDADILVAATGKPGLVTGDMVKPGAVVIDVGINRVDGRVVGDVDFESVLPVAGYLSPVPGGVGPMTIAMLMQNTVEAAEHYA